MAAASAGGRARRRRTPRMPMDPHPEGTPVEVRADGPGFRGVWFEATVVSFARARYKVTHAHLLSDDMDGGKLAEHYPPTHVRPRPPPADGCSPPLRVHDVVEAFHHGGWWSGIVFSVPDPRASVTVAFPLTREVIPFAPRLVRPRRDYVIDSGEWVPSRAVVVVRPRTRSAVRVYAVGEKVEVERNRDVYGYSWFPATIARVVDDLSYIVEYLDLEEEEEGDGGLKKKKATEYLHWSFIRPQDKPIPREVDFQLEPGAAVEAYCR